MRTRRRTRNLPQTAGLSGYAKVDKRTKKLTGRLRHGEVAIIDHIDIDRVSADALVACRPVAVLNAAPSVSGRYPNMGPGILLESGVPLIDNLGPAVMDISEGTIVTIDGADVLVDGKVIATGVEQTTETLEASLEQSRTQMSARLKEFTRNTMEYVEKEQDLIFDGSDVPDVKTDITDRHVLVVVRGYHYREDLQMLRSYVREFKPLMIGVDGGADAILEAGWRPDIIVGDMDSVSDKALASGAEIVVHAYRNGVAPGKERVEELGIRHTVFPATGTSEDVAIMLADDKGAEVIVAVGTHNTLVEFLDKGRAGMASTFLTRLRVGSKLIDAKGVSRLYRNRIGLPLLSALIIAALLALVAAIATTTAGQALWELVQTRWGDFTVWLRSLFGS